MRIDQRIKYSLKEGEHFLRKMFPMLFFFSKIKQKKKHADKILVFAIRNITLKKPKQQ
jgi:hypothetical protein